MSDPATHLATLRTSLDAQSDPESGDLAQITDAFWDYYVAVLNADDSAAARAGLSDLGDTFAPLMEFLDDNLVDRMERLIQSIWEDQEWLTLCAMRSTLEGLKELVNPLVPEDARIEDDEDIDEMIRSKGNLEAFAAADGPPAAFPLTHWWWTMD
ncbi:MAG: hypothetical protein AB3N09_03110 [Tateyamaria sp.]